MRRLLIAVLLLGALPVWGQAPTPTITPSCPLVGDTQVQLDQLSAFTGIPPSFVGAQSRTCAQTGAMVTWLGGATPGTGMNGRIVGGNGIPIAGQFESGTGQAGSTNASADANGNYLVSWSRPPAPVHDYYQLFDPTGVSLIPVQDTGATSIGLGGLGPGPRGIALSNGTWLIVWRADSLPFHLYGRFYTAAFGVPIGSAFVIANNGDSPSLAAFTGGFFVAWTDDNGADGDSDGVMLRVYQNDGTPVTGPMVVNATSTTVFNQRTPLFEKAVATDTAGNAMVVWLDGPAYTSAANLNDPNTPVAVRFQRFNVAGTAQGVNTTIVNVPPLGYPSVAADGTGQFFVVWDNRDFNAETGQVFIQVFGADGTPRTPVEQVSVDSPSAFADIDIDKAGNIEVSWNHWTPFVFVGNVLARRYTGCAVDVCIAGTPTPATPSPTPSETPTFTVTSTFTATATPTQTPTGSLPPTQTATQTPTPNPMHGCCQCPGSICSALEPFECQAPCLFGGIGTVCVEVP